MFKIIGKENLASNIRLLKIYAPQIAKKAKPGQFVVLMPDENSERIPLTLADWDREESTITLIFQEVGFTTKKLAKLSIGDCISHILGPLGKPTEIKFFGRIILIGGGVGIAEILPLIKAFKEKNNYILTILGARTKELLILEEKIRKFSDEFYITTDDGSYGRKGFVTDILKEKLYQDKDFQLVYAIGPVLMMKEISKITNPFGIKTLVSLNPIMVDATGMCGSCRIKVRERTLFACVDGPEFDADEVDFDELQKRLSLFKDEEKLINSYGA
ncbi:MAG: sulfide/dihydroorotate dehydrogenase-like FAD/NAD-binding protein [Candidatus Omnitrophica bacterium]|nr:sulfide/dihydroorotate dehydrogenase-like FAD/NAD-binding protein [Candidatus Omnitrophota bacterium]MCM8799600.1 sulfide/dihydroorotate dehydrogenase-like FAD/NAD-binding protein [Candidatus Omnitrophota bacterium]